MKNKLRNILFIVLVLSSIAACNKDFQVEYTATYPLNGEYFVKDYYYSGEGAAIKIDSVYKEGTTPVAFYWLFVYNTAAATKDTVWVDGINSRPAGTSVSKFKIKAKADVANRSFSTDGKTIQTISGSVMVDNCKIILKNESGFSANHPDSIWFTYTVVKNGITQKILTAGHRKTGYEPGTGWDTP